MSETWCTIESDPGVFTELIERMGVRDVQVEELYSFDESTFSSLRPIYGLIFLFKWTGEQDQRVPIEAGSEPNLFFANQVIPNACATQAILSVLLNCTDKIDIGETLGDFMSFTRDFSPEMKGLAISNSDTIRTVHNGFSPQRYSFGDRNEGDEKEDAFHFVAYIPHNGKVLELDGLKAGPIVLGEVPPAGVGGPGGADGNKVKDDEWLRVASPAIEKRIARYSTGEIRFNLMAIVKNRKKVAIDARENCIRRAEALDHKLALASSSHGSEGNPSSELDQERGDLEAKRVAELRAAAEFDFTVANENEKFARWRKENIRRKHDYVPFAVKYLATLAKTAAFADLMETATTKATRRREQKLSSWKHAERR